MEPIAQSSQSEEYTKKTKKRRKRGAARIAPKRKGFWKKDPSESSQTDSSAISDVTALTDEKDTFYCDKPFDELHICSESDKFSETASEFYLDSNVEGKGAEPDEPQRRVVRKRRKRHLAYKRKHHYGPKRVGSVNIEDGCGDSSDSSSSSDSNEDSDVSDISLPSDLDLSDINIDDDLEDTDDKDPVSEFGAGSSSHEPSGKSTAGDLEDLNVSKGSETRPGQENEEAVLNLYNNLKLLLPKDWSCDIVEHQVIRLININCSRNAAVQKCIYYDTKNHTVGIFVCGMPVSKDNNVFDCKAIPDSSNTGSVSDFLFELVLRTKAFKVCESIKEHQELWDVRRGFLDYSTSLLSPQFRSAECSLFMKGRGKVCASCQGELRKMEREEKRRERGKDDPTSTPDKDLSMAGIIFKKDKYKKLAKKEKQRADRLQKRMDALQIKLDAAMKDELSSILRAHQHKMTPLQNTFWKAQMQALSLDDKRGMRWHPMLIRLALHLHSLSDGAYQFLNDVKVLSLPSSRRLYDYSHFIETTEGCQQEITESIQNKIKKCGSDEHFSYINLMFDEMHIRAGLVLRRSTGDLIGYTNLDGVDEELRKMQNELDSKVYKPKLAKKVLVYMAQGITSENVKDVVAVYTTDELSVSQLYNHTWDVIYHLEDCGIKVLAVTCDGASVNRKFIFMHESLDKFSSYTYKTKNLASGNSRPLFFILDPPHLLKTIRNAWANSFSHKKSRTLWKNNKYLSWKVVEKLYELTKDLKFPGHKLTKAHVRLSSFSCMTVLYATQVMSKSVANCIKKLANHNDMAEFDTDELVTFILLMDRFFDCVNGDGGGIRNEEKKNPDPHCVARRDEEEMEVKKDKALYTDPEDERLSFLVNNVLEYFEEWKNDIKNRPGIFSKTELGRMIISHQALGALEITLKGIVGAIKYMLVDAGAPAISARKFNQDSLEQYFSKVRRRQGDNKNPTAASFLDTRLNLHAQGHVSLASTKGNTEIQKRKIIEIDSSHLPSRKRPSKSSK